MVRVGIATLLAAMAAAVAANAGTRQVIADGHASIVFPQPPGRMKIIDETPPGDRARAFPPGFKTAETWMTREDHAFFEVMVMERSDRSPVAPAACTPDHTTTDGAYTRRRTCRLVRQDGFGGEEIRTERSDGMTLTIMRMFQTPAKSYAVTYTRVASTAGAAQQDAEGQAFVESLRLSH